MDLQTVQKITELERKVEAAAIPEKPIDLISPFLALPGLRGFWPMSVVDYTNPQCVDIANGYDLTNNNTATFGYDPNRILVPCTFFDGVNQYLSRADGGAANWADVLGTEAYIENTIVTARGLTSGGWFFSTAAANEGLIGKWNSVTNDTSYLIQHLAGATVRLAVSSTGLGITASIASTNTISANTWYFVVGRYVPSTTVDIYLDGTKTSSAVGVPAALFDGAATFEIGSFNAGATQHLTGRASCCFLCAAAVSDAEISSLFQQTRGAFGV